MVTTGGKIFIAFVLFFIGASIFGIFYSPNIGGKLHAGFNLILYLVIYKGFNISYQIKLWFSPEADDNE